MAKRVLLIGLGLIGGSLALTIKKEHPDTTIVGFDVDAKAKKLALSLKVIDQVGESLKSEAEKADLIILSTPVQSAIKIIEELSTCTFKNGCIITDVGSTKKAIFQKASKLNNGQVTFIGGHPMAGSHKTGVEASNERLFENAYYILTPYTETKANKVITLQNWLRGTRAKFIQLDPEAHDKYAGLISHMPHLIAASLVHQTENLSKGDTIVHSLAAGGFRDITRIASASPTMWRDITMQNKDVLLSMIDQWCELMGDIRSMLKEGDEDAIYSFFSEAKTLRDGLPIKKKGAVLPFYDLFVDVPDHPGVISDVTSILSSHSISLTNIRIIESREDIMGVLRLSFRSDDDLQNAKNILQDHMYETYELT
ncbi:prephenate dehydrogenase [Bacillus shivajii]|uniref:prephenate dehydrogenase n=1 Tax=Bacillus shivajii TaxID=1983719 RepID=UPI001CFA19E8|nr:prephenate dehydrogenase [Bacillus shivajii]UCZ54787.1 prephenate dehydrogenase [Bacillus shivajii]